jgi:hypothetical protein
MSQAGEDVGRLEVGVSTQLGKNGHEWSRHFKDIIRWMEAGLVVPFIGAGANLCDRPTGESFEPGRHLPSGEELARSIAERFEYPWEDKKELLRVSWHAAAADNGRFDLVHHLHGIFDHDYEPTCVHQFFAQLPRRMAARGHEKFHQLIITTNYDDVMERALDKEGVEYDVVSYIDEDDSSVAKEDVGYFKLTPYRGSPVVLRGPNHHLLPINLSDSLERTIVLKIHGTVDRAVWRRSSFVITEDDYINYVARMKKEGNLPDRLIAKMQGHIFLFLGYSLSDWNLRVLLRSMGSDHRWNNTTSFAVMRPQDIKPWDELYWKKNRVELKGISLTDYIQALEAEL